MIRPNVIEYALTKTKTDKTSQSDIIKADSLRIVKEHTTWFEVQTVNIHEKRKLG